eukprot:11002814-Alexandrium_andersonii.AAC.1
MSASLVGSEMCIRDRPRVPRSDSVTPSGGGPQISRTKERRRSWVPARVSVSYTHLTLPTICSV